MRWSSFSRDQDRLFFVVVKWRKMLLLLWFVAVFAALTTFFTTMVHTSTTFCRVSNPLCTSATLRMLLTIAHQPPPPRRQRRSSAAHTHAFLPTRCPTWDRYTPQKNKQRLQLRKQRRKSMNPPGSRKERDRASFVCHGDGGNVAESGVAGDVGEDGAKRNVAKRESADGAMTSDEPPVPR